MTLLTLCPDSNTSNTYSDCDIQVFSSQNYRVQSSKYLVRLLSNSCQSFYPQKTCLVNMLLHSIILSLFLLTFLAKSNC